MDVAWVVGYPEGDICVLDMVWFARESQGCAVELQKFYGVSAITLGVSIESWRLKVWWRHRSQA